MGDAELLSDAAAHERLVAAREALGDAPGATVAADTALQAARQALVMLQLALIASEPQPGPELPGPRPPR